MSEPRADNFFTPNAPTASRPPRPSATLVLLRDSPQGLEVLLLCRAERGDQNSGAWVFPGGLLEAGDAEATANVGDAQASAVLGVDEGGLAFYVAAIRECFEECGVLLAVDAAGHALAPDAWQSLQGWRVRLHAHEQPMAAFCRSAGLTLAIDRLAYISHWVTPAGYAKRFDTRFFLALAPVGQVALPDGHECVEHRWIRPADAVSDAAALKLKTPTRMTLERLAGLADTAAAMAWARGLETTGVPTSQPHIALDRDGLRPVQPNEPAWAEVRHLDPDGRAPARCFIVPGEPVRLSPRVIRLTAPNASYMTGPGTNTYLVGPGDADAADAGWAVIDPGPDDPQHVAAILAAAPGPIRWIFTTHTHLDHSPAANALREATGAQVMGRRPAHAERQDPQFTPDRELAGGERLSIGHGSTLVAIHTPGHASNHLCYLLEEERTLFTGDHVMQGSTVVISPPDGDMGLYLQSLDDLLREVSGSTDWLAPGHGFLIANPAKALKALVAHRLRRERKVVDALRSLGPSTIEALVDAVYDDTPKRLHPVALRSLTAHLLKLQADGAAACVDAQWRLQNAA